MGTDPKTIKRFVVEVGSYGRRPMITDALYYWPILMSKPVWNHKMAVMEPDFGILWIPGTLIPEPETLKP